jgi:hypothetical protein
MALLPGERFHGPGLAGKSTALDCVDEGSHEFDCEVSIDVKVDAISL